MNKEFVITGNSTDCLLPLPAYSVPVPHCPFPIARHVGLLFVLLLLIHSVEAQHTQKLKSWIATDFNSRSTIQGQPFASAALSRKEAAEAAAILLGHFNKQLRSSLLESWKSKTIIHDNDTLRFEYSVFGDHPSGGRSLFISMHGGGNAPARVNDQQWKNQVRLYTPKEGVYLAPRAPTNTWNLWHESHIDTLFSLLIHAAVLFENVDRNKVYIMGYSAGGDGVYQLAPRMADYWAAAAMMAGHPNETSPVGLRNIGFTIHVGALDNGFNRNEIAKRWSVMLDSLEKADPGGYRHFVQVHEGRPHWMNREDTVAVAWLSGFTRNPVPRRVIWKQDDMIHPAFYWLAVPLASAKAGGEIIASYDQNKITIEKNYSDTLCIRLNDAMMNLDKPVMVVYQGKTIFNGKLKRKISTMYQTAEARKDPGLVFSAEVKVVNGKVVQ